MDILGGKTNQPVVVALTLHLSAFGVINQKYPEEVGMECQWYNMGKRSSTCIVPGIIPALPASLWKLHVATS